MPSLAVKSWFLTASKPSEIPSAYGYTLQYGREYYEWIEVKANRILGYLDYIYRKKLPLDKQELAEAIYIEKLLGIGTLTHVRYPKLMWKPVNNIFTDFKPSPFIKSFINFLVDWLINNGYLDENTFLLRRKPTRVELIYSCLFAIWREYA